jgi:hypothetical protein
MIPVVLREWREGLMRGSDMRTGELFSYVDLEERVPRNHPLRVIRRIVNEVLAELDGEFEKLYAAEGRLRLRLSACCGHFCCRRSTPSAPSGS